MKRLLIVIIPLISLLLILILQNNHASVSAGETAGSGEVAPRAYLPFVAYRSSSWAFEETFDGDPSSPSQALLPENFDFVVTHRTHPKEHFRVFDAYLADHNDGCAGPNPNVSPLPQHWITTSHESNGSNPDDSFFICKNHMMTSMGDVEGYSVTSFWPKQEFDFTGGGILEFEVNINGDHPRSWFEVLITPRSELKVGAAPWWLPIDETYPKDRIALRFFDQRNRSVQVGTGGIDPEGVIVEHDDWRNWGDIFPNDPANFDRRTRRTMRVELSTNQIIWSIEKEDGSFDDFVTQVPGGLPFTSGLVVFKTHAYTPEKDGNTNTYTYHWDNIRFSGPVKGLYESFDADGVAYLQGNGDREPGENETITINLPHVGKDPVLFGQVHNPMIGQVLLSINGRPNITVHPYDYTFDGCFSSGWKSFQLEVDPSWLEAGDNTFKWTIGPRANCVESWVWDGFSIKELEMQFDLSN